MKINLPENIYLTHPERYILTIYICPDKYSFSLYDPEDNGSYFYGELDGDRQTDAFSTFKDSIFENEFFTLPFRKIKILNRTTVFTYVPETLYQEQHKKDYMDFLFSEETEKILSQSLPSAGIIILHQLPEEIHNFLVRIFTNPDFIHYSAPLIAYFSKRSKQVNAKEMIVNYQGKGADIFCFSEGGLLLGNHFPCDHVRDIVYYIFFVWKQLEFDQQEDFLYFTGDSVFKKELPEYLKPYIRNIHPVDIAPEAHFDQVDMQNIPLELAALSLCRL
jgi:hypothetical protein